MKKHIALLLAASTLVLAGCCTSRHAVIWQYQTVSSLAEVNKMATEGWVVTGYTELGNANNSTFDSFLMKRPKQ